VLERKQHAEKLASEAKDAAEAAVAAARGEVAAKEEMVVQAKDGEKAANDKVDSATTHSNNIQCEFDCEWMFGDVGMGLMGFSVAKLNPLRWSGNLSIRDGISQLRAVQAQAPDRKIVVKVPGGVFGTEKNCQTPSEAVAHLQGLSPEQTKALEAVEAAKEEQTAAKAVLSDAEKGAAEAQAKLQSALADASSAEANLEAAKKSTAEAQAEFDNA